MKSRFFSNLSHEFKTPLQLITKPLEQRLARANTPEEKQELELMSRNAQRLSVLIEQLLDLSKLESGSMQLQVREDDIVQALKLVGASFASYADHKGIRFKVDIEPYSGPAFFDGEKVEKVLYNLLSNAFKFTGEKGTVQFRASVVNQHVVMFVKDSGIGIPQEKLPYIFNRFYQVEDPSLRFQEGSGIGLAICRELTELHRGTLTVESEEGQGSEFVFTIPISRSAYRKAEVMKHGGKKTSKRESTHITDKGLRSSGELPEDGLPLILIAEDDADMRFYIANTLKLNYRVISVADGRQAYDKALDVVPDLVVADVLMPHMDGRMLFHKLRSNAVTDHIPLVMLTERSDQQKPESGSQAAADDYLTKPFDARELLMRVHNLIQNRKNLFERVRDQGIRKLPVLPMPDADQQFLLRLTATLDAHFANPGFGIDQLTERIGMSRMQLHRKLKALTNKAPGELLRQFRLEHAQELINKGFTVTEVAFKTGFPDLNTFNRALRDFTKVEHSPVAKRQSPEHS